MNLPILKHSNIDNPIPQGAYYVPQPEENSQPMDKKPLFKRKWFITLVLILIIIPLLTGVLSFKKKTSLPHPETTLIATVGDKPIYLTDIQKVALEQYQPNAIDQIALRISYETLIERIILDKTAQELSINASVQEIQETLARNGIDPQDEMYNLLGLNTKYEILRNKIMKIEIESREAYSIGFYIASYDEQREEDFTDKEKKLFVQQRADGLLALEEAEKRLKQGEIPLSITRDLYKKYPSLQTILAVNGYILQSTTNEYSLATPKLYTYDKEVLGQPFFNDIYTMGLNEIKTVNEDNGSGGYVILVKSINHANIHTYEDWLFNKKKESIKLNVSL